MAKISLFLSLVLVLVAPATTLAAGTLPLSRTSVSLSAGESATIAITNPTNARVYVVSISDAYVAYANVNTVGNEVVVYGLTNGSSQVGLCSYDNYCNTINVFVGGSSGAQVVFNQNNVSLTPGQTISVQVSGANYGYYIQSNSNTELASAYLSGSDVVVTGRNAGFVTLSVCANVSNVCNNLNVTVLANSALYFTNSSPVPAYIGSYYSHQLTVAGGTAPYVFSLASGSLPAGLSLSSAGLIYGYPVNNSQTYFTVRATDYFGRTVTSQGYYLSASGSVQGNLIYNNGTLVNDNGTIYITYKNTKSGFANMAAFNGHGYKLGNVVTGYTGGLPDTNYVVSTSNISHPWGSWVQSGNTIYFSHASGLIPISTFEIFTNNGGAVNHIVPINTHDLNRAILPLMVLNDPRLKP